MQIQWLHRGNKDDLVIFCNGWGMDQGVVKHLGCTSCDVAMLYNYRNIDLPEGLDEVYTTYKRLFLVCWSMGVWVGQKLFEKDKKMFTKTIAFNGTLCPIDDNYGIPKEVYGATLRDFNEITRKKFYRRMCREKANLNLFLENEPKRSIAEQKEELAFLENKVDCVVVEKSIYDQVIVADKDLIMPTENQKRYWETHNIQLISGFHYLFGLFRSWEEIMECNCTNKVIR